MRPAHRRGRMARQVRARFRGRSRGPIRRVTRVLGDRSDDDDVVRARFPALCTRTVTAASAREPVVARLDRNVGERVAQLRRLRAIRRTTLEPTGVSSKEATAACSSIVVPFSIAPATLYAMSIVRSSPGATSPMCGPAARKQRRVAQLVVESCVVERPLPTR